MSLPLEQQERLLEKLSREVSGPIQAALEDKEVIEIVCNSDGSIWKLSQENGWKEIDKISSAKADSILSTVAALTDNIVNSKNPQIQCVFPLDGSRLQGLLPPAVTAPIFDIRKHSAHIFTIEEYIAAKIMTREQAEIIEQAIIARKNILISGGTCSGKTTLTKTIIDLAAKLGTPGERFVIIEDTRELYCTAKNAVSIHAYTRDMLSQFTQSAMRLRPDRVILGEVRGREAYDLMYLLNSGHPGSFTTIHANNARLALHKFLMLARESGEDIHPQRVVECFDIVISISRSAVGLRVEEIVEVSDYQVSDFIIKNINTDSGELK
jgi:type IV secretion system protein VirB11